jgi:hypothetical protein
MNTLRYDRALLLHGPKRNEVLSLVDVEQYGLDSFSDRNYISLYGMRPREWYSQGIRLIGRTAVECTRDALADLIGRDVSSVATRLQSKNFVVIDPFAGSCNIDVFSDGSQSLTINNHTVHYTPTVGTIWAEFLVDNLGDDFIVWHNNLPNWLGIFETAVICDVVDPVPGVPEPGTWAMMLLGFAGLGFAFRHSLRKV